MTNLSPAAKAVLDAFFTGDWEDESLHANIAAALLAAADHVETVAPWVGHTESAGVHWSICELKSIAAELEGKVNTPLSPVAQAVLAAVTQRQYSLSPEDVPNEAARIACEVAIALRAAADQVVPLTPKPNDTFCIPPVDSIVWKRLMNIRQDLLAIAAELEAQ